MKRGGQVALSSALWSCGFSPESSEKMECGGWGGWSKAMAGIRDIGEAIRRAKTHKASQPKSKM